MVIFGQKSYFRLIIKFIPRGRAWENFSRPPFLLSYIQIMCRIENVVRINKFFSVAYNMSGERIKVKI